MTGRRRLALAGVVLLISSGAVAHPSHTTVSEVDFNPDTEHLEVALRLQPEDLESALSLREGRSVILDREPGEELQVLCATYLASTFRVEPAIEAPLIFVGMEYQDRDLWLYFELPVPWPSGNTDLVVEVLMEVHARQLNTVYIRNGESRHAVTYSTDNRSRRLQGLIQPVALPGLDQ